VGSGVVKLFDDGVGLGTDGLRLAAASVTAATTAAATRGKGGWMLRIRTKQGTTDTAPKSKAVERPLLPVRTERH
jgi:hypothetical protein